MQYHSKQPEIETLVNAGMNVLLEGPRGSGKTTILKNVAESLALDFYTISMTKQTTLNALLGFISINGTYIPSQLRKAVEEGGMMLLDELDAGDPNVILCLNTLENKYLAFPDGIVKCHEDFRLVATSNPASEHQIYTGRSKLDAATLDRFDTITVDRDDDLEKSLVDNETFLQVQLMRKLLKDYNLSKTLSMRDTIRFQSRKNLGLDSDYELVLLGNEESVHKHYRKEWDKSKPKKVKKQKDCKTPEELWEAIQG